MVSALETGESPSSTRAELFLGPSENGSGPGCVGQRRDPLAAIFALGRRQTRVGIALGMAGALMVHGAAAANGLQRLLALESFAQQIDQQIAEQIRSEYQIEVVREKPPEPPPPEPTPPPPDPTPPEPIAPPVITEKAPPPVAAPPAAAQAGAALTAEPDPDQPVDLTGNAFTIVSGNGDRYAGGETDRAGTSKEAVRDRNARPNGVPGGTGTQATPVVAAAPKKAMSRPAMPNAEGNWNSCGFPAEADMDQIDFARVQLIVTVTPEGRAKSVVIQNDPGHGFGGLARQCALRKTYQPALDDEGRPMTGSTPPFWVRFTR